MIPFLVGCWAVIVFLLFADRVRTLHYFVEPWGFVVMQVACMCHALLVWYSVAERGTGPEDFAALLVSSLYYWRSTARMHSYKTSKDPREMQDVPDTRIVPRKPASDSPEKAGGCSHDSVGSSN